MPNDEFFLLARRYQVVILVPFGHHRHIDRTTVLEGIILERKLLRLRRLIRVEKA
jgi:hypothetical protein